MNKSLLDKSSCLMAPNTSFSYLPARMSASVAANRAWAVSSASLYRTIFVSLVLRTVIENFSQIDLSKQRAPVNEATDSNGSDAAVAGRRCNVDNTADLIEGGMDASNFPSGNCFVISSSLPI